MLTQVERGSGGGLLGEYLEETMFCFQDKLPLLSSFCPKGSKMLTCFRACGDSQVIPLLALKGNYCDWYVNHFWCGTNTRMGQFVIKPRFTPTPLQAHAGQVPMIKPVECVFLEGTPKIGGFSCGFSLTATLKRRVGFIWSLRDPFKTGLPSRMERQLSSRTPPNLRFHVLVVGRVTRCWRPFRDKDPTNCPLWFHPAR